MLAALPSLSLLFAIKLLPYRSLIASFSIFSILIIVLFISFSSPPKKMAPASETKLLEQKNQLESWLNKQPTHRDVLLNLAEIHRSLKNEQQALEFSTQAESLDPNNNIFQEN
jgi:cytochrome c-type biogenesis protein CcmH/NrfG